MHKRLGDFIQSKYFKSISQLTTGSFIAQIITLIVAPISTRLYTAEQLGVYTLILTLLTIFGPVICGKYDLAIVSAKDDKEVMELIWSSTIFSVLFLFFISIFYRFYLTSYPEIIDEVGNFAYIVIFMLFIRAFTNILTSYNNRYKEYKTISSVYVVRSLVQNIGLVLFGFLKFGAIGLLFSQLIGSLFGLRKQSKHLYKNILGLKFVRIQGIKNVVKKYRKQPIYSMPAHFLSSTSYSILNLFISSLFGLSTFGYYSMSYRILGLPLSLVSMNVSKVFFQKATEEKSKYGNYYKAFKQITLLLLSVSIPMVIILISFGPYVFELFFGEGWYIAGVYVQILAPMYGIRLIVSALTPALIVSGKQRLELIIQSCFLSCSVLAYLICKLFTLDMSAFLSIISISYSLIYIVYLIIIYKLSLAKN
ncbi:oligosaccharide flippase family protein [Cytobacillus sp. Sa5YUA1]|uniref:Oligosaccharide flippase family protein n=1 Tax=Cytobacillus stercorigallinarum TaxID=2762240 RepID=A0ABR8QSU1_9BACI|nr:oligosaccharide flippase family protein [Cytobacillus stercorigallinarum]MBD7938621.1 oligosaccharide flippase family protein [Cytobacillus stercorigallinarum]